MTKFLQTGFLSSESDKAAKQFQKRYSGWIELYHGINEFSFAQLHVPDFINGDTQGLLILSCYYRMLTVYQSAFLLIERGNDIEAKGLLRTLLESLLVMGAASNATSNKSNFVQRYVLNDENKCHSMIKTIIEVHKRLKASNGTLIYTDIQIKTMLDKIEEEKASFNDTTLPNHISNWKSSIENKFIAEEADLLDMFELYYSFLCKFAHPSPYGMRRYLEMSDKGLIKHFIVEPIYDGVELNMEIAMSVMLQGLEVYGKHFRLTIEGNIKQLRNQFIATTKVQKTYK